MATRPPAPGTPSLPEHARDTDDGFRMPPGPGLPPVVQTVQMARSAARYLQRCQQRYGDCFTLHVVGGERLVCVAHPDLVRQVFTGDPDTYHGGAHNAALGIGTVLGAGSLLVIDGEEHRRQRHLVSPPFRGHAVRRYQDTVAAIVESEIARWPLGTPFALYPHMQSIALEVILRAVIGESEGDRLTELRRLLPEVAAFDLLPLQFPALFQVWPWRRYRRVQERTDELLHELIAERRKASDVSERADVLSMLVGAEGDDRLTDDELRNVLITFLIGGHETTTTALSWTFERLMRHPEVMARLVELVRGDEDDEAYVDAVVRETLRVRPVISLAGRKLTRPVELGEFRLPAGVNVLTAIGLVQSSSRWFPDSEAYRPERFLDTKPDPYTWLPFGGGHRGCPGGTFASYEIKTVLRTVLRRLEVTAPDPRPERPRMRHVTMVPGKGARAVVHALA